MTLKSLSLSLSLSLLPLHLTSKERKRLPNLGMMKIWMHRKCKNDENMEV